MLRAALSAASAMAGVALAIHHPLSPALALAACGLVAAVVAVWPGHWPALLLGLMPVAGLATWTGWLSFEELDLLVLAIAAGGYARWVGQGWAPESGHAARPAAGGLAVTLLFAFAVSVVVSLQRGLVDAGGLQFGWWQSYLEPMNSVRLAKPFAWALLLLPLWWLPRGRGASAVLSGAVALGMQTALGLMALLVVWERVAFPGLLNFSTDYRTTALFWEMHVGGAALDACLAMSFPFALQALWTARGPKASVASLAVIGVGLYACITTFSRIVFLAVPLGVVVVLLGRRAQSRRAGPSVRGTATGVLVPAGLLLALFAALAVGLFPTSGYRGVLAALVALALMLPVGAVLKTLPSPGAGRALLGCLLEVAAVVAMAGWLPKGAYIALGVTALSTAGLVWRARSAQRSKEREGGSLAAPLMASFAGVVTCVPMVAVHWGNATALPAGLVAAALIGLVATGAGVRRKPLWPADPMWQLRVVGAMVAVVVTIGVFMGGGYLSGRFSTSSSDSTNRMAHWQRALSQLHGLPDWVMGKGLGRFPVHHFLSGTLEDQTGDHRLVSEAGRHHLLLTGGKHVLGWGEFYRISQRVSAPVMPTVVNLDLRAEQPLELHFEVCEKHLLYERNCVGATAQVKPTGGQWKATEVPLTQADISRGAWYAPRLISFSVAVETRGARIDIGNLRLRGGNGVELLDNGDFAQGMARWYFSSDRNHMPWHTKGLGVHVLFEQGLVGAALLAVMLLIAVWRLSLGSARDHELAPPLLAALVGVVAVGLIDSLLDMPRVGLTIYLLLGLALALRPDRPPRTV